MCASSSVDYIEPLTLSQESGVGGEGEGGVSGVTSASEDDSKDQSASGMLFVDEISDTAASRESTAAAEEEEEDDESRVKSEEGEEEKP